MTGPVLLPEVAVSIPDPWSRTAGDSSRNLGSARRVDTIEKSSRPVNLTFPLDEQRRGCGTAGAVRAVTGARVDQSTKVRVGGQVRAAEDRERSAQAATRWPLGVVADELEDEGAALAGRRRVGWARR